jgi:arylsulfatase A-like enzyme
MAKEGVRFTRYYAPAPICSPSRCGMLTGQFPGRWRITSYMQTRAGNRACQQADFLDPKAPSLPRVLQASGYRTAHIGKWHLGGGRDVINPPKFREYGYDLGLGTWESPEPHPDLTARDWIWSADDKVKRWDRTAWMVDRTLDFLKADPDRPCFVNLWLDDPHTPWVPSADDQQPGPNGRATGKGDTPERLAKVLTEMDRQVGRLLDGMRARKSGRPTVVLFLSDNGPLPTFDRKRAGWLRGSKLSLYEGGLRLPFLAWGPGVVPAGLTNDTTVLAGVDLFPRCARCAGRRCPRSMRRMGRT